MALVKDAELFHLLERHGPALIAHKFQTLPDGVGDAPPSRVLDLSIPTPALSAGVDSFRFVGQALFVGSSGYFEGGPSTLLLVDSAL